MHTRPRLLAGVVATLSLLAALLPGLTSTAYAGERAAPSAVTAKGGYRQVTITFAPVGGQATYEVLRGDSWAELPTKAADGSRLQGTVTGLGDGEFFLPSIRADYGNGSYSARVDGPSVSTLAAPGDSVGGEVYASARQITFWMAPGDPENPDGVRITADAVKRGVPTGSVTCAPNDGCRPVVNGLRKGQRYLVTVEAFNQAKQDGKTYRLFAAPTNPKSLVAWNGPQAPRDLEAAGRDGEVVLSWIQDPPAPMVSVTDFQVKVGRGAWRALSTLSEGDARMGKVDGLVNGRTYRVSVRGLTPSGVAGLPATVFAKPTPDGPL